MEKSLIEIIGENYFKNEILETFEYVVQGVRNNPFDYRKQNALQELYKTNNATIQRIINTNYYQRLSKGLMGDIHE